jgi:quercetin dioxygenase-like cupin family protein
MAAPEIQIGIDRDLFIRHMTFLKAGDQEPEHRHAFDHHTVLFTGKALFKINDKLVEQSAPALVFIAKNTDHQITALEDGTQCACVHYIGNLPISGLRGAEPCDGC